jgi:hypothetical protein
LPREELLQLRTELRVAEWFGETVLGIFDVSTRFYKGIDPTRYGGASISIDELHRRRDEI